MKNYLIIGGSSGIGEAITERCSKENHRVWATYRNTLPETQHPGVNIHYLDVLDETMDLSFLPEKLDGMVYCPGAIVLKPFARIKEEEFVNDFKLQVLGAVKIIQAVLPQLKQSDLASIVLFSTVAVKMGFSFHSIVSTSKGAIEGLTRALAAELAPNIRVNCIAPSITNTPLAKGLLNTPEKMEANAQRHALKKIGTAQDLANAAYYLLSDESAWMTGQIIQVDGGMSSVK